MSNQSDDVTISRDLYKFLMGTGPLEGVWFGDLQEGLPGRFWWRGLLRCAAGWPEDDAQGIEAPSGGETAKTDSTGGESPVPKECARKGSK